MNLLNLIEVETPWGYRTYELHHGDITQLDLKVDVLAISAFKGNYAPDPATVIGALHRKSGVSVEALSAQREYDFVDALGCWVAKAPAGANFERLLCAEFVGGKFDLGEVIENVFVVLSMLGLKGVRTQTLALPALGAGNQQQSLSVVIKALLDSSQKHMNHSPHLKRVLFVEYNKERADELDRAMNDTLGRVKVVLPKGAAFDGVRREILATIEEAAALAGPANRELFNHARRLIGADDTRSFELGIIARRLVEFMVDDLLRDRGKFDLFGKIDALRKLKIADWIMSYMHVLRVLGNEAAHEKDRESRKPASIVEADMALCLYCLHRLLEFWVDFRDRAPDRP